MHSGHTLSTSNSFAHQLNVFHGKPSYLISEWNTPEDHESPTDSFLPLANQSSSFQRIEKALGQTQYIADEKVGGLLQLHPESAVILADEISQVLQGMKPYLAAVRGEILQVTPLRRVNPPRIRAVETERISSGDQPSLN